MKWSLISTFGNIPTQLIITIVLARLLLPRDFGILGMSLVVIAISRPLIESGLNQALIQKKHTEKEDFSVVFTYNLLLSLLFFLIIFFSANAIENFYGQEKIGVIVKVLSVVIVIEAFSLTQRAALTKAIRFKEIAKANIFSTIISGSTAICLAMFEYGIWALVWKQLIYSIMMTAFYWYFNPIKISLSLSWHRFKSLFNFGAKIFFADQIESISNQLAPILIGKNYTAGDLGFYDKARQLQDMLSQSAIVCVNKVVFPSFAQVQDDNFKLKNNYKTLIKTTMLIMFPSMFSVIIIADNLIPLLLGDKWMQTIPYFKILCIGGMVYPFTVFNLNIIKVKGHANLYLKINLLSKGLLVPAILIGLQFHITGLVIALVIQKICAGIINSLFSGKLIGYNLYEQIKDVFPFFLISALLFIVVFLSKNILDKHFDSDFMLALSGAFLMFIGYIIFLYYFCNKEFKTFSTILLDSIK